MFKKSATCAFAVTSALFAFVPESFFHVVRWIPTQAVQKRMIESGITEIEIDTVISRVLCFATIWVITAIGYGIYKAMRRSVKIKGDNYAIEIKYGDIFKEKNAKQLLISMNVIRLRLEINRVRLKLDLFVDNIFKVKEKTRIYSN